MPSTRAEPFLLDDEQMRSYIANGYLRIDLPSVPAEVHEAIAVKLDRMLELGPNLGNNLLPHTPEFRHVLNSPEVRGALSSLLGPDYIEHPHRYCHNMAPFDEAPEDLAEAVGQRCHQDSYTPMSRPRQHYPRYARIIYYPRDTPVKHGPTHVTPGSQFNKTVTGEDRAGALPMEGPAGSLWITHFDVIHGAGINLSERTRHMIKFIYLRRYGLKAPAWKCQDLQWKNPENLEAPWDLEVAWSHMWDWMCGKEDRWDSFRTAHGNGGGNGEDLAAALEGDRPPAEMLEAIHRAAALGPRAAGAVPALAGLLNGGHQAVRAAATYALGAIGEPAVPELISRLEEAGRRGWVEGEPAYWSEGTVQMMDEAHALGAVGKPAIDPLTGLLDSAGEWGRINAAFALGEMDSRASGAVPALTRCLEDDSHRIVRTAIDALGTIADEPKTYLPRMRRFLVETRPDWEEGLTGKRSWMARDQVRVNAATAMARLGAQAGSAEEELVQALDDPCGYVSLMATDALRQLKSPSAREAVTDLVMAQRWDSSLYPERPW